MKQTSRYLFSAYDSESDGASLSRTLVTRTRKTIIGIMDTITILEIIAQVVIIVFFSRIALRVFSKAARKLPPGPIGLPFVGYLPFLTKKPYVKFSELRKKYGNVFGLHLGSHYTVVLGDPAVVREAFSRPEFLGRPETTALSPDKSRISMSIISGQPWIEQRRFVLHSMKDLGMGKSRMEEHIKDELAYLIEAIQNSCGEALEIKPFLASCTNNIILALLCGRRLSFSDPLRKQQNRDLEVITDFMAQTSVQGYIPSVMKIPGVKTLLGYDKFREAFTRTMDFIKEEVTKCKENLSENEASDFVRDYLLEIQKTHGNPSTSFSELMLEGNMMMLFLAGSETVRTTIDWALYIMAAYPDIQHKVQKEIYNIVGFERWPCYLDHKEMPFTVSTLNEVLRWRPALPINLQRCTLADTTLCGYDIPKGTTILANVWDAHHNPRYWEDAEDFVSTRFLNEDNTIKKTENYMPFSYGKRACPGQSLATVEVFLFVTAILQRFNVSLPKGCRKKFEGVLAIVNQPTPHKLCFTTRTN